MESWWKNTSSLSEGSWQGWKWLFWKDQIQGIGTKETNSYILSPDHAQLNSMVQKLSNRVKSWITAINIGFHKMVKLNVWRNPILTEHTRYSLFICTTIFPIQKFILLCPLPTEIQYNFIIGTMPWGKVYIFVFVDTLVGCKVFLFSHRHTYDHLLSGWTKDG